jgi:hypothetical protein
VSSFRVKVVKMSTGRSYTAPKLVHSSKYKGGVQVYHTKAAALLLPFVDPLWICVVEG